MRKYGTKEYFDELYTTSKEPWGFSYRASQQYRYDLCLQILKQFSNKYDSVLDIGCSQGQFSVLLKEVAYRITAIDIAEVAIQRAQKNYGNIDQLNFEIGGLPSLKYTDASFDLVLALEVLSYLEKEEQINALKEIKRLIRDDGFFLISVALGKEPYFSQNEIECLINKEFSILQKKLLYNKLHLSIESKIMLCQGMLLMLGKAFYQRFDEDKILKYHKYNIKTLHRYAASCISYLDFMLRMILQSRILLIVCMIIAMAAGERGAGRVIFLAKKTSK